MEIFIFVWKTSKQAVTDNQNQNLHSNGNFFLIKNNNSHSFSAKENWAQFTFGGFGAWSFLRFFYVSNLSLFSKVFATFRKKCCTKPRNTSMKPKHWVFLQNISSEWPSQGSPSRPSPTAAFLGEYSARFFPGNWSQLPLEAENAWAGSERAFPCVHAFLNMFLCFLFALVVPMGSSVWGAGPQHGEPCIAPKYLIQM